MPKVSCDVLANDELIQHHGWLVKHELDPLVDLSPRAQYRRRCFHLSSARIGQAIAKASVMSFPASPPLPLPPALLAPLALCPPLFKGNFRPALPSSCPPALYFSSILSRKHPPWFFPVFFPLPGVVGLRSDCE